MKTFSVIDDTGSTLGTVTAKNYTSAQSSANKRFGVGVSVVKVQS